MEDHRPARLWGGRFGAELDRALHRFTASFPFDRRLVRHDLVGSLAHARMLAEAGILAAEDARAVLLGLAGILQDVEEGRLAAHGEDEDVHTWIERVLRERVGDAAGRLHTARSRNDQVSTALRLYVRDRLRELVTKVVGLQEVWVEQASAHLEAWMPGYTHLQRAQPVSLAHHLMAHVWALNADARRLQAAHHHAGVSVLGAGALAGTSLPIRPERTAWWLGFSVVSPNSLHAVADRDYVLEAAFGAAVLLVHLSRWAEEVVLWSSSEFGFVELLDTVAKGSSLMPQKKNPEVAELIRGKAARGVAALSGLLTVLKGMPLAYNSDLQEDKEMLFDALDTAAGCLEAARVLASGVRYRTDRMRQALHGGYLTATDLADYLVRRGVPFRTAHEQAGQAVREAEARGCELWELPLDVLQRCCPAAERDVYHALHPEDAARARRSLGGPAPERVTEQLEAARREVETTRAWLAAAAEPPIYVAYREGRLLQGL
ncbi:MAG: argininosuccinate lyase [Armatimonadota bacterium]|nr:argininosuccinate lyase [Armatimonadota bacterium]MDW8155215.1 argininosuccinate lyase [Armatimonadota bacterium]